MFNQSFCKYLSFPWWRKHLVQVPVRYTQLYGIDEAWPSTCILNPPTDTVESLLVCPIGQSSFLYCRKHIHRFCFVSCLRSSFRVLSGFFPRSAFGFVMLNHSETQKYINNSANLWKNGLNDRNNSSLRGAQVKTPLLHMVLTLFFKGLSDCKKRNKKQLWP